MKNALPILFALLLLAPSAATPADIDDYWINEVMTSNDAQKALGNNILFFFGDEPHGKVLKKLGNVRARKKTRSIGKTDQEACHWVFLSTMKQLKADAIRRGGNAVINIRSNYKDKITSSSETFKCGSGTLLARVALIGTIIKMER